MSKPGHYSVMAYKNKQTNKKNTFKVCPKRRSVTDADSNLKPMRKQVLDVNEG